MTEWNLEIQIGLTQILALNAFLVGWFVSRVNSLPVLLDQLRILRSIRRSGWIDSWVRKAWYGRCAELLGRTIGALGVARVLWSTFHYLFLTDLLIGRLAVLDFGLLERIRNHAAEAKQDAMVTGSVVVLVLLVEVALSMSVHDRALKDEDVPRTFHPYVVPRGYEGSLDALWEERFRARAEALTPGLEAKRTLDAVLRDGSWRASWPRWASSIGLFCGVGGASGAQKGP